VKEDAPGYSAPWASNMSPGEGDEEPLKLDIACNGAVGELFSEPPAITQEGVLTFMPAPGQSGRVACTVTLSEPIPSGKSAEKALDIVIESGAGLAVGVAGGVCGSRHQRLACMHVCCRKLQGACARAAAMCCLLP
jgi:hypothetical protein